MVLPTVTRTMLKVAMVMATCLIALQCAKVEEEEEETAEVPGIHDIEATHFQQSYNENGNLLVFIYRLDCKQCPEVLETLTSLQKNPKLPSGLKLVKSFNNELVSKLGVDQFPSIVYLRDKSYAFYDGNYDADDLIGWIQLATNKIVHRLDDETFPLLDKAVGGEKVDDWLVAFYNEACKSILPVVETFGVRVHGQIKVGKVHIPESPQLTRQFKVTGCPEIIFFKEGEVYRFQSETVSAALIKEFVSGEYKIEKPQAVPDVKVESDFSTKNITDFIKTYTKGDNKNIIVAGVGIVIVALLIGVVFCCRAGKKNRRKLKKQ